jgi:hypothetical protein
MKTSINFGDCTWNSDSGFTILNSPYSGFPVPKLTTSISKNRTSSQQYLSSKQTIELQGNILGSGINDLLSKALALKSGIIVTTPKEFRFNLNTVPVISGTGYVTDLQFDTNKTHATSMIEYTISIDFDSTTTGTPINYNTNIYHVSSVDDNISIALSSETYMVNGTGYPLYDITRTISAKGNRYFAPSGAIVEAIRWINDRRAIFPFTGMLSTGQFPLFNHSRNLDISEIEGNISITDKFVSKPHEQNYPWIHKYNINTQIKDDVSEDISIKGTIIGLVPVNDAALAVLESPITYSIHKSGIKMISPTGIPNIVGLSDSKFNAATSGYHNITGTIYSIVSGYYNFSSGIVDYTTYSSTLVPRVRSPLNATPTNFVETFNPYRGEITYSFTFDNRPPSYISGAISEIINVSDSGPTPRTASIPVLGRRLGPVVYFYTASSGLGNRSVSYEGVFASPTGFGTMKVDIQILRAIDNLVNSFGPTQPYSGYVVGDDQRINVGENRITRSKTWSYTIN